MNAAVNLDDFESDVNDYDLPEPEHVELVMDGMLDTVTGNEGFNLTNAQIYLYSVLDSNDVLTHTQRRDGNESFFGTIGSGLKAIWDFIMRMFKAIGNFFFGSSEDSAEKKIEKTDAVVAKNEQVLKKVADKQATAAQTNFSSLMHVKTPEQLDSFTSIDIDKHSAEEIIEILRAVPEKPTQAEEAKVIHEVAEKLARINTRARQHIVDRVKEINTLNADYITHTRVDHSDKFSGTSFAGLYDEWHKALQDRMGLPPLEHFGQIVNLTDGLRAQRMLRSRIGELKSDSMMISTHWKAKIISSIKALEVKIGKLKKDDKSPEAQQFNKDLTACKFFLSALTRLAKMIEHNNSLMESLSNDINKLFGVKS